MNTNKFTLSCITVISYFLRRRKFYSRLFAIRYIPVASPFTFERNLKPIYKVPISLTARLYLCIILRWSDNVKFNLA